MADKSNGKLSKFLINIIYCLLSCVIFPLLVPIMTSFMLMKLTVNVILKLRYGKSFGGILQSADAVSAVEDVSKSIINAVLLIKVKQNNIQDFTQSVKGLIFNKIFKQADDFPKLTSIRLRSMGYSFLLKGHMTVEDCVSTLKVNADVIDKNLLQKIVSEYSNQPLPKENSSLWEILISPQAMKWDSNEAQVFPILIRLNHAIGDGLSLIAMLFRIFAEIDIDQEPTMNLLYKTQYSAIENTKAKRRMPILLKLYLTIKNILYFLFVILIAPMKILQLTYLRKKDHNSLHGPHLSGEKLLVWAVEEKQRLVSVVKTIKRAAPGSRFSDVMLTAISGSLKKHFKHESQFIPDYVTTTLLQSTLNMGQKPVLQNQFTVALLELPILMESNSLVHRLQEVARKTNVLRNSPDFLINYWLLKIFCGVIPEPILKLTLNSNKITMILSNIPLPGLPKLSGLDGSTIEDIIFYIPHRGTAGVSFTILTYDNRFQLGLAIDKSILSCKDKAQLILDDVFKEIDLLHEELCRTVHTNRNVV